MEIKILGYGCNKCSKLSENIKVALEETSIEAEIVHVEDLKEIVAYGVMSTPTMVIDDEVVAVGKVLKPKELVKILEKHK